MHFLKQSTAFTFRIGPFVDSTLMMLNPETGAWEYCATFRASDLSDGPIEIRAIAYPTGIGVGQHTKIGRAVREAGYELGFSGNGLCRLGKTTDPLDLRRVGVDLHVPEAYFRACVVLPPLGFS